MCLVDLSPLGGAVSEHFKDNTSKAQVDLDYKIRTAVKDEMRPNLAKPVHQEKEEGREGSNRKMRKRGEEAWA